MIADWGVSWIEFAEWKWLVWDRITLQAAGDGIGEFAMAGSFTGLQDYSMYVEAGESMEKDKKLGRKPVIRTKGLARGSYLLGTFRKKLARPGAIPIGQGVPRLARIGLMYTKKTVQRGQCRAHCKAESPLTKFAINQLLLLSFYPSIYLSSLLQRGGLHLRLVRLFALPLFICY